MQGVFKRLRARGAQAARMLEATQLHACSKVMSTQGGSCSASFVVFFAISPNLELSFELTY